MAVVVNLLQRFADEILDTPPDPMLGPPTMSVGTIHGGISVNTVPDHCTIEIDRRLTPNESPTTARDQMIDWLNSRLQTDHPDVRVTHDPPYIVSPGLSANHNGQLAEQLLATVRQVEPNGNVLGVPFGTDAAYLAADGTPTVVFGPGSIAQAHTKDEWIAIDQLQKSVEILTAILTSPDFCNQRRD